VLTVGDNELAVRDDDAVLLEVAEDRACVGELRKLTWLDRQASSNLLAFLLTTGTER